jgi:hypothetical protein
MPGCFDLGGEEATQVKCVTILNQVLAVEERLDLRLTQGRLEV